MEKKQNKMKSLAKTLERDEETGKSRLIIFANVAQRRQDGSRTARNARLTDIWESRGGETRALLAAANARRGPEASQARDATARCSIVRYCRQDKEVCCQINNLNEITAGKSSVPESAIKFPGGAGFSPGLIHVQPLNVKPDIIFAGEHGHHSSSSTSKSVRDTSSGPNSVFSSTVDYSDTKFGDDVRFASTFQGPAYLPPIAVRAQALAA
ncbi:hypothetical protein GEV33_014818 [Tenebrio molitor]|uniref:Uncharacterized protein n=1 Tax=Tenebrio molitor TaxID=7067 RepID=A0A8J6H4I4_TENMO|nr:hypothetical protein GEV33_014820 [Tenebrio molitor]KAH0807973.1 hypothetical protein GEV33_014818 [Tenebrio molitor]